MHYVFTFYHNYYLLLGILFIQTNVFYVQIFLEQHTHKHISVTMDTFQKLKVENHLVTTIILLNICY